MMTNRWKIFAGTFVCAAIGMIFTINGCAAEGDSYVLPVYDITASSQLPDENGVSYGPWNLLDDDSTTAWAEGVDGDGVGEYLELYVPAGDVITGISILPGYYKSKDMFYKNSAPTSVRISSGTDSAPRYFTDWGTNYKEGQGVPYFALEEPVVSDGVVRITIGSVREGSQYTDTCISDLELWGYESSGQAEMSDGYMYDTSRQYNDWEISQMVYLAQYLAKQYAYQLSDLTLTNSELSADDCAFGLYWYQYMAQDTRIQQNYDDYTNVILKDNAADILNELFGEGAEIRAMDSVLNNYAERYDENKIVFNASGDFGDAGMWFTDQIIYRGVDDGEVVVNAQILRYDEASGEFPVAGMLEARYDAQPSGYSGYYNNYIFRSVTLDAYNDEPGNTAGNTYSNDGAITVIDNSSAGYDASSGIEERLGRMAIDYYEAMNDYRPAYADCVREEDGTYSIHLYDIGRDATFTSAWYSVDSRGIGRDTIFDEPVNLNDR